jgi:hypothetical protein
MNRSLCHQVLKRALSFITYIKGDPCMGYLCKERFIKPLSAAIVLTAMLLCTVSVQATEVDPSDFTLIAYEITPDQEKMYERQGATTAAFWTTLQENSTKYDMVHLTPAVNGVQGQNPEGTFASRTAFAEGDIDGNMWTWAAWGEKGLYVLMEVQDDAFVDAIAGAGGWSQIGDANYHWTADYWENDCIDFFLDIRPSSEQSNFWVKCVFNQITNTTWQYQYRFGGSEAPDLACINFPPPGGIDKYDVGCNPAGKDIGELTLTPTPLTDAFTKYGISVKVVKRSATKRAQEWFFPWTNVAAGISMPTAGQKISFSCQYNDMDPNIAAAETFPDFLFMVNKGNPYWTRKTNPKNWGDIEFGGKLSDAVVSVRPGKYLQRGVKSMTKEYYSLDGRKLSSARVQSAAHTPMGLVLTRDNAGVTAATVMLRK